MFWRRRRRKKLLMLCWFSSIECPFCSLYIQTYLLNACKLGCEQNLFDFYVESVAFRIKILMNRTLILWSMTAICLMGTWEQAYILIKHRQLCSKNMPKVWFAHVIYHISKCFYACVGVCACNSTTLLEGRGEWWW